MYCVVCVCVCVCVCVEKPVCVDELQKPSVAISRTLEKGKVGVEMRQKRSVEVCEQSQHKQVEN